jgi:hypothetical protein
MKRYSINVHQVKDQLNNISRALRVWHVLALAMIATGILSIFYQYTVAGMLIETFGYTGFYLWAITMVLGGLGVILRPQYIVLWTLPFLVRLFMYASLAVSGATHSAVIFYAPLYLFTLYFYFQSVRDKNKPSVIDRFTIYEIAALFNFLMFCALMVNPSGISIESLYAMLSRSIVGIVDPVLFMRGIFLFGAIVPLTHRIFKAIVSSPIISAGMCIPFIIYGFGFLMVTIFGDAGLKPSLVPMFVAALFIWSYVGAHRE